MEKSILVAGFGGQGVLMVGQLIGICAYKDDKVATFYPSYGPEQRGGTANCMTVVSDDEVGFPIMDQHDVFVPMNKVSLVKYQHTLRSGGFLLADESLKGEEIRTDVHTLFLPADKLAEEAGSLKSRNLVIVGALCRALGMFRYESIEKAVEEKLGKKKDLLPTNLKALELGWNYSA